MSEQKQELNEDNHFMNSSVFNRRKDSLGSWRGNKYPSVKLRGFYSEIVSNQNADKTGVIDHFVNEIFEFQFKLYFNLTKKV
jgi:hypothetical protein